MAVGMSTVVQKRRRASSLEGEQRASHPLLPPEIWIIKYRSSTQSSSDCPLTKSKTMEPEADTINSRPNLDEASDMDPALVSALYDRVKTLESKIESIEV
jgi:hypothetical protein